MISLLDRSGGFDPLVASIQTLHLCPRAFAVSDQRVYSPPNPPIKSSARFSLVSQSVTFSDISWNANLLSSKSISNDFSLSCGKEEFGSNEPLALIVGKGR